MDVHTYLRYNNIALIDPTETFHKGCIDYYNIKGYLSPNQLNGLRGWAHSQEAIERLTAGVATQEVVLPTTAVETVVESPKNTRWKSSEVLALYAAIDNGTKDLEALSGLLNRSAASISNVLYGRTVCAIRKGKVLFYTPKEDELPF